MLQTEDHHIKEIQLKDADITEVYMKRLYENIIKVCPFV